MISLLVLDIDGVLTDGRVGLGPSGEETKSLAYRDIDALFQARRDGLQVALVTGERSPMVDLIGARLAVDTTMAGAKDKAAALREVSERLGVPLSATCYVGDADRDVPALALTGLGLAPADASAEARRHAHRILSARGGAGAVAEALDVIRSWNGRRGAAPAPARPTENGFERAIRASLAESVAVKERVAASLAGEIATFVEWVVETFRAGGKLLLFGNGGSAADAQHIAAEFVGRYETERRAWPAIALSTDTSILTALGNDYGVEHVFARQIEALGQPGDLAVAFSTSGNSPNVLNGVVQARLGGLRTVALTGQEGGRLAPLCDLALHVPSRRTSRIQECHITICHVMCEAVEAALADVKVPDAR